MIINSNLIVTLKELQRLGYTEEKVEESLSLPNPQYVTSARFGNKGRFFSRVPKTISYLFKDKDGKFVLPRYYLSEKEKVKLVLSEDQQIYGRNVKYNCTIKMREYQREFLTPEVQQQIRNNSGVLLEAACGTGKTILGIYLSFLFKKQTLVLVPTYYLAKQWKSRIEGVTDASVFILSSESKELPTNMDFTIIVMDLFVLRAFPKEFIRNVGHIILDEAHRVGAETYLPILNVIPAYRRTALTATFRRNDGVHKILKYHFGELFAMKSPFAPPKVYPILTGVEFKYLLKQEKRTELLEEYFEERSIPFRKTATTITFDTPADSIRDLLEEEVRTKRITKTLYKAIATLLTKSKKAPYVSVDTYLNEHSGRRKLVIALIKMSLESGRTVLFLSKRKDTLRVLYKYFEEYKPVMIVSETKERTLEEETYLQEECQLILGVTQLAKEGLDIDRLDTLIIHLPSRDVEQALGRISRLHPKKQEPVAFYLLDNFPMAYAIYKNAQKYFTPEKATTLKGLRGLFGSY